MLNNIKKNSDNLYSYNKTNKYMPSSSYTPNETKKNWYARNIFSAKKKSDGVDPKKNNTRIQKFKKWLHNKKKALFPSRNYDSVNPNESKHMEPNNFFQPSNITDRYLNEKEENDASLPMMHSNINPVTKYATPSFIDDKETKKNDTPDSSDLVGIPGGDGYLEPVTINDENAANDHIALGGSYRRIKKHCPKKSRQKKREISRRGRKKR